MTSFKQTVSGLRSLGVLPRVLRRLNDLSKAVGRLVELYELDLQSRGVYRPEAQVKNEYADQPARSGAPWLVGGAYGEGESDGGDGGDGGEGEVDGVSYTDEELDYARELAAELGKKVEEAENQAEKADVD